VIPSVKTPAAVGELVLGQDFERIELRSSSDGSPYASALLLARRDGENLGLVRVVARDGILEPDELRAAFDEQLPGWDGESDRRVAVPRDCHVTVVVTARGRHEALAVTLESVFECEWRSFDVVVVDSGTGAGSADFLRERFGAHPQLRCVEEPREGASLSRNAGLAVAQGEIVAFTDEGAEVDEGWIRALVGAMEETGVECVTGPALPLELETPAQALVAGLTGSTNESTPRTLSLADNATERLVVRVAEQLGPGLNVAVRADTLRAVGAFDPALGPGTVACGAEDLDLYVRLLQAGHAVSFQPDALVWRGPPRDLPAARRAAFARGMSIGVAISKHVDHGNNVTAEFRAAARHIRRRAARPDNPRRKLFESVALAGLAAAPAAYSQSVRAPARLPAGSEHPNVVLEPPPAPAPVAPMPDDTGPVTGPMPDDTSPVTPRWVDLGLAALIAAAVAVAVVPVPSSARILVTLLAACLVPGGALVRYLHFDFGASWLAMAAALSLAVETLASLALIWTGWWHPVPLAIGVGAISVLMIVFDWSRHRGAGPALPA
jgi:GT2 family glycosyltransferase